MSELARRFAAFMTEFLNEIKSQSLEWEQKNASDIIELREEKAVARETIQGRVSQERAKFRNALQIQQLEHQQKIEGIRISGERRLLNFEEFLDSVDDMKQDLQKLYPEMPRPTSLLIHHHASNLLEKMWHEKGEYEHEKIKDKFVEFLMAAQDDALSLSESKARVPQKILRLIESQRSA